jgi:polyhydroxyalkanoate synthesis regulator phasin
MVEHCPVEQHDKQVKDDEADNDLAGFKIFQLHDLAPYVAAVYPKTPAIRPVPTDKFALRTSSALLYTAPNKPRSLIMLQELMYTGLGGAMLLKENVERELKRLEEKGRLSKEESESFMDKLEKRGKEEEQKLKEEIKKALKEVIEELGLATKADIEALKTK